MKNLKQIECVALTDLECQQADGGSDLSITNFWHDIAYVAGVVINGFVAFGAGGGKNAGIVVR